MNDLKQKFIEYYGDNGEEIHVFFAPGRVNLIGEHTDYNGGYVLPCSLHFGTYLLIRLTNDNLVRLRSMNFPFSAEIDITNEIIPIGQEWVNYPLGIIKEFSDRSFSITGMELLYSGDIPNGAGLSSSASIEMVTAFAMNILFGFDLEMINMIKLSQHAENEFVGMKCGIMDQFAVAMGKKDHAVFLNCDTLEYEQVPVVLNNFNLIITNTNKRRELAGSKYNERRWECEKAVEYINKSKSIRNLSELSLNEFIDIENVIPSPVIRKRAKHVISENQRVLEAVKSLKTGNLFLFGKLMYESHYSLSKDYEVSCMELDILVDEAAKTDGVLGSRMTGGGFGGCTVSIVDKNKTETFITKISKNYLEQTGLNADFYIAKIGDGVKRLNC